MKSIFLIAVLATLALAEEVPAQEKVSSRSNLNLGSINSADRLLHRNYYSKASIFNAVQTQDITFRGSNNNVLISAIRANEVGYTQYAYAFLVNGGIGRNNATVRLQSARGYGYNFQVEFWGR